MRVGNIILLVLSLLASGCAIGPTAGNGERSVNAELAHSLQEHCWGAEQVDYEEPFELQHLQEEPGNAVKPGCNATHRAYEDGCHQCNGRGCSGCRGVLGRIGAAMATTPAQPLPDINVVPSRFHPAPVRPVFSSSGPNWGPVAAKPNGPALGGNLGGL
jgi:hypothetical protein